MVNDIGIAISVNDWRNMGEADQVERMAILRDIADAARFAAEQEAERQGVVLGIRDEIF